MCGSYFSIFLYQSAAHGQLYKHIYYKSHVINTRDHMHVNKHTDTVIGINWSYTVTTSPNVNIR